MNKRIFVLLNTLVVLTFIGCSNPAGQIKTIELIPPSLSDDSNTIAGYVMDKKDNKILVVSTIAKKFSSSTDRINEYYEAAWFSGEVEEVSVGQFVEVWYVFMLTSYPGQSEAIDLKVIKQKQPRGAKLKISDALDEALQKIGKDKARAVTSFTFDRENRQWLITLKGTWRDEEVELIVRDN